MSAAVFVEEDLNNGGYLVRDSRDGMVVAWRYALPDAVAICSHLNACYPAGSVVPAWDTLVHEAASVDLVH